LFTKKGICQGYSSLSLYIYIFIEKYDPPLSSRVPDDDNWLGTEKRPGEKKENLTEKKEGREKVRIKW
jgi:hypothetical protein